MTIKTDDWHYSLAKLPSRHQFGDAVILDFYGVNNGQMNQRHCIVNGVHFYAGKVKYDLIIDLGEDTTRIYNVDSTYVFPID